MPSPFPGMNPFLEQEAVWTTFHHHYIGAMMESLVSQVCPRYTVHIGEHVNIHDLATKEREERRQPFVEVRNSRRRQRGCGY